MRYVVLKSLVQRIMFTIHVYNVDIIRYVEKKKLPEGTYSDTNHFRIIGKQVLHLSATKS